MPGKIILSAVGVSKGDFSQLGGHLGYYRNMTANRTPTLTLPLKGGGLGWGSVVSGRFKRK